jgi:predicted dehydrogenase
MSQRVRICIAGLNHDHVFWILRKLNHPDVEIAGFYEPDRALAERYSAMFGFPMSQVYADLPAMLDALKPTAVAAFNAIYHHLEVVEACAPRGISVMVEKPLAVSSEHAARMAVLARKHDIHLLTNFETSWYASTYAAYAQAVQEKRFGAIRKIVVRDGHFGPVELGCTPAFLAWLTDPVLNGGGAVIDFGCYGAGLVPWLMGGALPLSVTAVTQTLKPEVYPHVDDEANIFLTYPGAVAIIQGSWNWPLGRKDLEIYGANGYILATDATHLRARVRPLEKEARFRSDPEEEIVLEPLQDARADPFAYLAGVMRGEISVEAGGLYSLENNLMAVRILDAARESARSGRSVPLES